MDIDHFKRINDTFGHPVGDRVLAQVGEALRATVREHELIARVGGEEFAWILPEADREGALAALARGLARVARCRFRRRREGDTLGRDLHDVRRH